MRYPLCQRWSVFSKPMEPIMRGTVLLLMASVCVACMTINPIAPGPLLPVQTAATVAVLIEDHLEDPEQDAKESSPIELLADMVNAPMHVLYSGLSVQVATLWGMGEWLLGLEPKPEDHFLQVSEWIGPRLASVPPPEPSAPSPTPTMDDWRRTRGTIRY